jgi:hypothetical protein
VEHDKIWFLVRSKYCGSETHQAFQLNLALMRLEAQIPHNMEAILHGFRGDSKGIVSAALREPQKNLSGGRHRK